MRKKRKTVSVLPYAAGTGAMAYDMGNRSLPKQMRKVRLVLLLGALAAAIAAFGLFIVMLFIDIVPMTFFPFPLSLTALMAILIASATGMLLACGQLDVAPRIRRDGSRGHDWQVALIVVAITLVLFDGLPLMISPLKGNFAPIGQASPGGCHMVIGRSQWGVQYDKPYLGKPFSPVAQGLDVEILSEPEETKGNIHDQYDVSWAHGKVYLHPKFYFSGGDYISHTASFDVSKGIPVPAQCG